MQCFSEFEYLLGTQASRLIFSNKMPSEPSKNKKERDKNPLISNNIPLVDIFPRVTLVWGCRIPSDESFISVSPQTLDQLDRC